MRFYELYLEPCQTTEMELSAKIETAVLDI